jgi:hypothetical protein
MRDFARVLINAVMYEIEQIIARDFANVSGAKNVLVTYDVEDETITVVAYGETWLMQIGSDDDEFVFHCGDRTVHVPFSKDYLSRLTAK